MVTQTRSIPAFSTPRWLRRIIVTSRRSNVFPLIEGFCALWLLAIGFAAYALWRLSEAAFGVTGEGNGAGPRLKSLGRAVIYAGFAVLTFKAISGAHGSQSRQQQDLTAKAMQHPAV